MDISSMFIELSRGVIAKIGIDSFEVKQLVIAIAMQMHKKEGLGFNTAPL
jgi:hypothetical protein